MNRVTDRVEGALIVGGLRGLAAALYSLGIPKDSIVAYEIAIKADGFLVMAHGFTEEIERARMLLRAVSPTIIDVHSSQNEVGVNGTLATA